MTKFTALIRDVDGEETVGTTSADASVGDMVTVTLRDENGLPITRRGILLEVLEEVGQ